MKPQTINPDSIERRTFLKAAAGGSVATAALSGKAPGDLSPVQEGESLALTTGAALVIGGAVIGTGIGVAGYHVLDDEDPTGDTDDVLEDQIYNTAVAVADGRSRFIEEMKAEYADSATGTSPFADAAWSEIRAAAAESIVNGGTANEAKTAAQDALKKAGRRAGYNIIQRWNTGVLALGPHLIAQYEQGITPMEYENGNSNGLGNVEADLGSGVNPVSEYQADDGYTMVAKTDVSLPGSSETLEEVSTSKVTVYGPVNGGNTGKLMNPFDSSFNHFSADAGDTAQQRIYCEHRSFSDQTVWEPTVWNNIVSALDNEYGNISNDLGTYVDNLKSALDQGVIDASDIYAPSDIVEQFADTDNQNRVAAELIGMGAAAPDQAGYEALVSHTDLSADELWVDLYVRFDGDPIEVKPDMTLASADYRLAYIGYVSEATGNYVTEVLSGDSDLTIHNVAGVDDQQQVTKDTQTESDGTVVIGSEDEVPDRIKNPDKYNGTTYVVVEHNGSTYRFNDSQLSTDVSGNYTIDGTSTPWGASVDVSSIEVLPAVNYTQGSRHVDDPANVSSDNATAILESQRSLVNSVENLSQGGGGGSLFGDGGLLSGTVFGVPKSIAAAGGAAAAAYAAMQGGGGGSTTVNTGSNK